MYELAISEVLRYRRLAIIVGLGHLLGLLYLNRLVDLPQQSISMKALLAVVYLVLGLLFGAWQMYGYRKPNQWLNLLHRPLAPGKVALALGGASALLLAIMVWLPLLAALLWMDWQGRMVESLHFGLARYGFLVSLAAYLAAACATLAPPRWGQPLLLLPCLYLFDYIALPWLLVPMATIVLWLALCLNYVFKADRSSPPSTLHAKLILALPAVLALYWLLKVVVSVSYQAVLMGLGSHPSSTVAPPQGSFEQRRRITVVERIEQGLRGHSQAAHWLAQVEQAPKADIYNPQDRMPVRHQAGDLGTTREWQNPQNRQQLRFNHQAMLFDVRDHHGRHIGWQGRQQAFVQIAAAPTSERFARPMLLVDTDVFSDGEALYQFHDGRFVEKFRLASGEYWLERPQNLAKDNLLLSNQTLILAAKASAHAPWQTRWRLPLPQAGSDLSRVDVVQMDDGYLVSLLFGRHLEPSPPSQQLYHIDGAGKPQLLYRQKLTANFPAQFQYGDWLTSPLLYGLNDYYDSFIARHNGRPDAQTLNWSTIPAAIVKLALLLQLMSVLASLLWAWWVGLSRTTMLTGVLASSLLSWPGWLCWAMLVWPERAGFSVWRLRRPAGLATR